jgi:putative flavoprotein involved in K+ transport
VERRPDVEREVAVVGAGPGGLAVAACLRTRGIDALVLERGAVGASWRGRYDRLHLHTIRSLSGLPGRPIPRAYGRFVARDDLVAYLVDYAGGLDVRTDAPVERVERTEDAWVLRSPAGDVAAPAVVVATGFSREPFVPDWPGRDRFGGELVHSAEYRNAASYAGRSVLVVGAGNSGAEIAAELAGRAAKVWLSVRTPPNIVRRQRLGVPAQLLGLATCGLPPRLVDPLARTMRRLSIPDLAAHGLPIPARPASQFRVTGTVPVLDVGLVDAVLAGRVEVVAAVERLDGRAVVLADGRRLEPDAVVAATGFRPGLEPLVGHLGVLDPHGAPLVQGATPAAPGLWLVGFRPALGGLLRRIGRDAPRVARAVSSVSSAA